MTWQSPKRRVRSRTFATAAGDITLVRDHRGDYWWSPLTAVSTYRVWQKGKVWYVTREDSEGVATTVPGGSLAEAAAFVAGRLRERPATDTPGAP